MMRKKKLMRIVTCSSNTEASTPMGSESNNNNDPQDGDIRLIAEEYEYRTEDRTDIRVKKEEYQGWPACQWYYEDAMVVPSETHLQELRESIDNLLDGGD